MQSVPTTSQLSTHFGILKFIYFWKTSHRKNSLKIALYDIDDGLGGCNDAKQNSRQHQLTTREASAAMQRRRRCARARRRKLPLSTLGNAPRGKNACPFVFPGVFDSFGTLENADVCSSWRGVKGGRFSQVKLLV